jgi:hypothetical protein
VVSEQSNKGILSEHIQRYQGGAAWAMSLSCIERRQSSCGSLVEGEGDSQTVYLVGLVYLVCLVPNQTNQKKLNKPKKPDGPDPHHAPRNV